MKVSMNSGEKFVTIIHQEVYHRAAKHREIEGLKLVSNSFSFVYIKNNRSKVTIWTGAQAPGAYVCVHGSGYPGRRWAGFGKKFSRVPSPISLSPRPKTNPSMDQNSVLLSCVLLLSKK